MSGHTPPPWSVKRGQFGSSVFVIYGPDGFPIAQTISNSSPEGMERARRGEHEANAERIVRCVNAHDDLVAALTKFVLMTDEGDDQLKGCAYYKDGVIRAKGSLLATIEEVRAALAKVGAA